MNEEQFVTRSINIAAYSLMKGATLLKVELETPDRAIFHIKGDPDLKAAYKLSEVAQFVLYRQYMLDQLKKTQRQENDHE